MSNPKSVLPYFASGTVVKGFGRGSKELKCPTANMDENVVRNLPVELVTGVYFGWAQIDGGEVHEMVMSIGWNPFYKNTHKTMEIHILKNFQDDFYGRNLRICMLGFLRPEKDFSCLDELLLAIESDIAKASLNLQLPWSLKYKTDSFFTN